MEKKEEESAQNSWGAANITGNEIIRNPPPPVSPQLVNARYSECGDCRPLANEVNREVANLWQHVERRSKMLQKAKVQEFATALTEALNKCLESGYNQDKSANHRMESDSIEHEESGNADVKREEEEDASLLVFSEFDDEDGPSPDLHSEAAQNKRRTSVFSKLAKCKPLGRVFKSFSCQTSNIPDSSDVYAYQEDISCGNAETPVTTISSEEPAPGVHHLVHRSVQTDSVD